MKSSLKFRHDLNKALTEEENKVLDSALQKWDNARLLPRKRKKAVRNQIRETLKSYGL